jgi:hypothetical protein
MLPPVLQACVVSSQNQPYVFCEQYVLSYRKQEMEVVAKLEGFPNSVAVSLPHTEPRLAIAGDDGLRIVRTRDNSVEVVSDAGFYTNVTFMHGARLIAVTLKELRYFQKSSTAMKLIERVPLQTGEVVALLPLSAAVVGVLYKDGLLERFRIGQV